MPFDNAREQGGCWPEKQSSGQESFWKVDTWNLDDQRSLAVNLAVMRLTVYWPLHEAFSRHPRHVTVVPDIGLVLQKSELHDVSRGKQTSRTFASGLELVRFNAVHATGSKTYYVLW